MKLIIGNYNYSSWSLRAWLLVRYFDLPVEIVPMGLSTDAIREELSQHFSNQKVPLLLDGDLDVWDSIAIFEYFAEKFPASNLWPQDSAARAVARSVSAEMHSSYNALRGEAPMNCRTFFPDCQLSEAALKDLARIQETWRYCRSRYGADGPWLFGEFSIVDAMFAPVVLRFRSVKVELDEVSTAYCKTMNDNSFIKEWIALALQEDAVLSYDELDLKGVRLTS